MITREEIRELAQFQSASPEDSALSFYFQPQTPQNKSHREENILIKDLVKTAMREAERKGKNGPTRAGLNRIIELASTLQGNQAHAKAVFSCFGQNYWREFDLPPLLPETQLFVNDRFHLKPLALLLGAQPRLEVAVVDRQRARFFHVRLDEVLERESLFHSTPRRGRSDGYAGYDAGHAERRGNDDALHHFRAVAQHLHEQVEKNLFDRLIVGCNEPCWHEFEAQLHTYVKQRTLGRFACEVASVTPEQVRTEADRILQQSLLERRQNLVREVLDQAKSNARGVTGLRRVLRAMEMGEVQTLFIGEKYSSHAVECTNCGHVDAHMVKHCPVCGHATRELQDVCDAIITDAIRKDIELFYVKDDEAFDNAGNIAALLRFRVDQKNGPRLLAAS